MSWGYIIWIGGDEKQRGVVDISFVELGSEVRAVAVGAAVDTVLFFVAFGDVEGYALVVVAHVDFFEATTRFTRYAAVF
jgi:hypothetical protein